MIVRELITRLGYEVDSAQYNRAQQQYNQLRGAVLGVQGAAKQAGGPGSPLAQLGQAAEKTSAQVGGLGTAFGVIARFAAGLGLSAMLHEFVTLASDANETSNVLGEIFGPEGRQRTEEWSKSMGEAMGRSAYDLQAYASRLGSVLGPVTKTQEQAEQMATSLAGLAVDLGSFFNTTDQEAMMALRSGLTGEYESLKRYGVVINEATLAEVAHQKGIRKKVSAMTVAEKTELRYAAIMERTKAAQGDAARTGQGFANATKALRAQLKDLGIGMAMTVIPAVEKVVRFARDAVTWFNKMAKGTNVLKAAMYTLGAVALVLAGEMLLPFVLPALAVGALILLVDELITLFEGGETAIGRLINAMAGDRAAQNWVLNMIAGFSILGEEIGGAWDTFQKTWGDAGGWSGIISTVQGFWEDFGIKMGDWAAAVGDAITLPFRKLGAVLYKLTGGKVGAPEDSTLAGTQERSYERAAGRSTAAGTQDFNAMHAQRESERNRAIGQAQFNADQLRLRRYAAHRGMAARVMDEAGVAAVSGTPGGATSAAPGAVTAPAGAGAAAGHAPPSAAAQAAAGGAVMVPVSTAAPTINIQGGNAAEILRVVKQALAEDRKRQIAALPRQGGT